MQNVGVPSWEGLGVKRVDFQEFSPCDPNQLCSLGCQPVCSSAPPQPPSSILITSGVCAMGWGSR